MIDGIARDYGKVSIAPEGDVTAGAFGSWQLRYRVGRLGVDDGGAIQISFRQASDWRMPQCRDPVGEGFVTAVTRASARLLPRFEPKGGIRPFRRALLVDVVDGYLGEGDEVVITLGDRSGGGPGIRAQSFVEKGFVFRFAVDAFGTGQFVEFPSSPRIHVVAGPARRFRVAAPTTVGLGEAFSILVCGEDQYGNVAEEYVGAPKLKSEPELGGIPTGLAFRPEDRGVLRLKELRSDAPATVRFLVEDPERGLIGLSNPIDVRAEHHFRLYWGDIHGQTGETVGTGSIRDYFSYARDIAGLDFSAHCGNDFQMTCQTWQALIEEVEKHYIPGRFVTFLSYEWSGNTPAGGDRNVYYPGGVGELFRSSHTQVPDHSDAENDRYPVSHLFEEMRGKDVLIIPHIGGRAANLEFQDPDLERLIEVHSVHGTFEWFLEDALRRGLRVGFIAGSDDHTGRPGTSAATFGRFNRGGLVAVYANSLTREGIWEALRARRCYGTSGERIKLWTSTNGRVMGEEFQCSGLVRIEAHVLGTGPLDSIDIFRGTDPIYTEILRPPAGEDGLVRIQWSGARAKTRNKRTVWDGHLTIEGGRLLEVIPYGFRRPDAEIGEQSDQVVTWRSSTFGDSSGLSLRIVGGHETELRFVSGPATFTARLGDIAEKPYIVRAGGVGQEVALFRISRFPGPTDARIVWEDEPSPGGPYPYFVRVTQADGEKAWSSPTFVWIEGVG